MGGGRENVTGGNIRLLIYYIDIHFVSIIFTGVHAKRHSTNIERIRCNTVMRRKRLFDIGIKRKISTKTRFNGPDSS